MTALRAAIAVLCLFLVLVLISSIGQTATLEDFWYENQALFDQTWGAAALADLYGGFALMAVIMSLVEGSIIAGVLWAAPLLLLGNLWACVWMLLRLPRLVARLRPASKPAE